MGKRDEAWANRARRQSKVADGVVYEPFLDAFIDYNVESMNCMKCSLDVPHPDELCRKTHDRNTLTSDALGFECTKVLVARSIELVKSVDPQIAVQIASDNDINYSECFESLRQEHKMDISKLDDVNHALKGINTD